jgi:hypothetical protein
VPGHSLKGNIPHMVHKEQGAEQRTTYKPSCLPPSSISYGEAFWCHNHVRTIGGSNRKYNCGCKAKYPLTEGWPKENPMHLESRGISLWDGVKGTAKALEIRKQQKYKCWKDHYLHTSRRSKPDLTAWCSISHLVLCCLQRPICEYLKNQLPSDQINNTHFKGFTLL